MWRDSVIRDNRFSKKDAETTDFFGRKSTDEERAEAERQNNCKRSWAKREAAMHEYRRLLMTLRVFLPCVRIAHRRVVE